LNPLHILVYAYGNPGRKDDGLGNEFVERLKNCIEEQDKEGFSFDSNYQLNIEDAATIADQDLVVFVDASDEEMEDFLVTPVLPEAGAAFTTHAASAGYILNLCKQIFGKWPATFLVHIKGYEWEFAEGLSEKARLNLEKAAGYMLERLKTPQSMMEEYMKLIQGINRSKN
jgi:hydrogenase maturation protease